MKKLLALLLALVMAFSLVACNKDDDDDDCRHKDKDDDGYCDKCDEEMEEEEDEEDDKAAEGRDDFIDDLGGVSETFEGAVSAEEYDDPEKAAIAYVTEEITGNTEAVVESVESKGELSQKEIKALDLPDEISDGMTSIEKLEVEYSVMAEDTASYGEVTLCAKASSSKKVVVVYVIKYGDVWKYYSPAPVTGETITKSYYDSVFNAEKYKNCTLVTEMSMDMDMTASYQGQTEKQSIDMYMKQTVMHADGKVYVEQYSKTNATGTEEENYVFLYFEEVDGIINCYSKSSPESTWTQVPMYATGFSSLEDLTPFNDQYLDYTYFTKTDFGFAIEKDNAKKYVEETILAVGGEAVNVLLGNEGTKLEMYAEYYVSEGVLSGLRSDVNLDLNVKEDGASVKMTDIVTVTTSVTDYGTTVIESPIGAD